VDLLRGGIIHCCVLLGKEEDILVRFHGFLKSLDRFVPAYKKRNDHIWKNHDIPEGKQR